VIGILSPWLTEVGKRQSTRGVTYYMIDLKFSIMVSDSPVRTSSTQTKKAKRSSLKTLLLEDVQLSLYENQPKVTFLLKTIYTSLADIHADIFPKY
jgi:hypothetical protein